MTCDQSCRVFLMHKAKRLELPRAYPLERICCAVAHLAAAPTSAHRAATLRVIRAQLGADHEATVRKAWDSLRAERKASGSDPSRPGPDSSSRSGGGCDDVG